MAVTRITDVVQPTLYLPYMQEETTALSAILRSRAVSTLPENIRSKIGEGGGFVNMPSWAALTGADEVLEDTTSLTPGNITSLADKAVMNGRGRAWGSNDLAGFFSGDDPQSAIARAEAAYWAEKIQDVLIATLTGIFADNVANDSSDLVSDISTALAQNATAANLMSAEAIINAKQKLGDHKNLLNTIVMHSVCHTRLQILNLIDFTPTNAQNVGWGTYLGMTVIVDDACPTTAAGTGYKYSSYIVGDGAIMFGENGSTIETDRDILAGDSLMATRRYFIIHVLGFASTVAPAADFPTNAELNVAGAWNRVYQQKNCPVVELITNG